MVLLGWIPLNYAKNHLSHAAYMEYAYFIYSMYIHAQVDQLSLNYSTYKEAVEFLSIYFNEYPQTEDFLINMAYNFGYLGNLNKANELLDPFIKEKSMHHKAYVCWLKINFPSLESTGLFDIAELMDASNELKPSEWVSIFYTPFRVSHQFFEYEPLYRLYCMMSQKGDE
jgi:hypothetical protein